MPVMRAVLAILAILEGREGGGQAAPPVTGNTPEQRGIPPGRSACQADPPGRLVGNGLRAVPGADGTPQRAFPTGRRQSMTNGLSGRSSWRTSSTGLDRPGPL